MTAAEGEIVQPIDPHSAEVIALFRDPGSNVMGLCQRPGLAAIEATGARP